ncbi:MAG TPA: TatD family hydrolase [Rhodothermales bacterium]|nr:TatD family hydrolase [Rhodothermales bacterium]
MPHERLIDTHAHIYLEQFEHDLDKVLDRARAAGVESIVMPAIDLPSIHSALALSERYEGLYVMVAIHPSETKHATDAMFDEMASFCREPRVVAVGESGLDYYWDRSFDDRQQDFFRRHIRLALEWDLPLVIHNRQAGDEIAEIIAGELIAAGRTTMKGIFHCFGGPEELGEKALAMGFHLGIGGTLTFKNSGVSTVIAGVPLDRIVLETDSPFLAPAPHRGKRNEPAYVRLIAERLAADRGMTIEEVARVTSANAQAAMPGLTRHP